MLDFLIELDKSWFLFFNGFHNAFFDSLMYFISGTKTWIPLYLVVLFFIFRKLNWKGFLVLFFLILLIVLADQGSVTLFKNTFQRLRPCHNPEFANLVHLVNNECGGKFGFISSHAANTFAFATFTALFFNNKSFSIPIFLWAIIVSYSRIYLGVHYPFDVLGGAFFGISIGYIISLAYQLAYKKIIEIKKPR